MAHRNELLIIAAVCIVAATAISFAIARQPAPTPGLRPVAEQLPASTPTPAPPPPTPTPTPFPPSPPPAGIGIAYVANTQGHLKIRTAPGASCNLAGVFPNGATFPNSGFGPVLAGPDGLILWDYDQTSPGVGATLVITCSLNGQTATLMSDFNSTASS